MTRKKDESIPATDFEAAIAAFIDSRGVTHCPTACATATQAWVPAADRAALQSYQAAKEGLRRKRLAGRRPLLHGSVIRR
jgi:hypothetical protein